jgi:signal recognition particle receptor subunit beta
MDSVTVTTIVVIITENATTQTIKRLVQKAPVVKEITFSNTVKKKRKKIVGLERGPLSLVSITEELFDRKVTLLSRKSRILP